MKRIILLLFFLPLACFQGRAQDTAIQQYAGKYNFATLGIEAVVTVINGELSLTFPDGTLILKRIAIDTFAVSERDSWVEFRRNEVKKITMLLLFTNDLILEGTKETAQDKSPAAFIEGRSSGTFPSPLSKSKIKNPG